MEFELSELESEYFGEAPLPPPEEDNYKRFFEKPSNMCPETETLTN